MEHGNALLTPERATSTPRKGKRGIGRRFAAQLVRGLAPDPAFVAKLDELERSIRAYRIGDAARPPTAERHGRGNSLQPVRPRVRDLTVLRRGDA